MVDFYGLFGLFERVLQHYWQPGFDVSKVFGISLTLTGSRRETRWRPSC